MDIYYFLTPSRDSVFQISTILRPFSQSKLSYALQHVHEEKGDNTPAANIFMRSTSTAAPSITAEAPTNMALGQARQYLDSQDRKFPQSVPGMLQEDTA
jgi:hypothetical protein